MLKLKDFEGVEVFVDVDGKFIATMRGKRLRFSGLRDLEERILETKAPLVAMHVPYPYGFNLPEEIRVTRIEDDGRLRDNSQYIYDAYSRVYLYDERAFAKFTELFHRNQELRQEWEDAVAELTLLTRDLYVRHRQEQRQKEKEARDAAAGDDTRQGSDEAVGGGGETSADGG